MCLTIYKSEEKIRFTRAIDRSNPTLSSGDFLVHQCSDVKRASVDGYLQTEVRLGTTATSVRFSVHMNLPEIRVIVFR